MEREFSTLAEALDKVKGQACKRFQLSNVQWLAMVLRASHTSGRSPTVFGGFAISRCHRLGASSSQAAGSQTAFEPVMRLSEPGLWLDSDRFYLGGLGPLDAQRETSPQRPQALCQGEDMLRNGIRLLAALP